MKMWVLAFTVTGDHYFSSRFISRSSSTRMKESSYLGQAKKHGKWPLSLRSCSRYFQRSHPASVHSPFPCNLAQIPTVRAAFLCRRSFSCGWTCFTLSASVAETEHLHVPHHGHCIDNTLCKLPPLFCLRSPLTFLCFLGSHMKKTKNYHIFILEPFKARGMERSDWASQDLAPPL